MGTESKRQQRFAGVIQQDLAELFLKDGQAWTAGNFITITKVRMTPDLSIAKVYLSFLESDKAAEGMESIQKHAGEIRYKLGVRIKNHARIVPQLVFFVDDTNEYVDKMDRLFEQISQESRQTDEEE